jgi:hypothetical protein
MTKMDELYAEVLRLPDFPSLPERTQYGSPIHVAWRATVFAGWKERLRLWTAIRAAAVKSGDESPAWALCAAGSRVRECEDAVERWARQGVVQP